MESVNPITKKVIVAIILASAAVHLLTLFLAQSILKTWRWEQIPFHSAIEISGSVIAFFVAYMLVLLEKNNRGTSFNYIVAAALIVMGVLDGLHSVVPKGQLFVWLHSCATLFGGVFFLAIYLPKTWRNKFNLKGLFWVLFISLAFATVSMLCSDLLPLMADANGFTSTAIFLNVSGGLLLLISAIKLFITYRKTKKTDDLLFVLHCTMFGFAAIMFQQSVLWDVSWWGWHILRFFAYGVALWFALANELLVNLQIKDARDALNEEVEIKSAQLTQASQLLKVNQAQQNAIFRCLTDAIIVFDKAGDIIFFSQPAQRMFGFSEQEVEDKNISRLLKFSSENSGATDKHAFVTDERLFGKSHELIGQHKDETYFPVEMLTSEVELNEQANIVAVIREISARKQYELALKQAKEQADIANSAKSAFLANMSHEIRTPMNGVYGNLQLLAKENLSEDGQDFLEKATYSTKSLMTIIDDILDISKIEAGKLEIQNIDFSLAELVNNLAADLRMSAKNKGINFECFLNVEHDSWLGDPIRLRQIILNIAANAVKFTEAGKVQLLISYQESSNELCFEVTDTGIGMSEKALEQLFIRFEQADGSITRKYGGTGLGMSITNALVGLMQGKLQVTSTEGKGTKCMVLVPMDKGSIIEGEKESAVIELALAGKTILVAEDNRINQTIVKAMLKDTQAKVEIAQNGLEAIAMAKTLKPDLILMDIQMPKLDGIEACKAIKNLTPTLPIIALTANVMSEDIKTYKEVGFEAHVGKPIELELLFGAMRKYLF